MLSLSKFLVATAITASALSTYPDAIYAEDMVKFEQDLSALEKRINLLEKEEVVCGPITVSPIRFNHVKHFATLQPGQSIDCSFHYKLDSSQQEFLSKN